MLLLVACETGTRYDKNVTIEKVPESEPKSAVIDKEMEYLLDDKKEVENEGEPYYDENAEDLQDESLLDSFTSGVISDGLDVRQIREGKHNDGIRLVFDIYKDSKPASTVGRYNGKHLINQKDIEVVLNGYRKFSASLPSFSQYSIIEKIYFEEYSDDSGFKVHIKLRRDAKVKIFDLKNPARIVFDIKSI